MMKNADGQQKSGVNWVAVRLAADEIHPLEPAVPAIILRRWRGLFEPAGRFR